MQLTLRDGLILVPVTIVYQGREIQIPDLVVDTGSATTLLSADVVAQIGITPEFHDVLHVVRGVGGAEVVFGRRVDRLQVGTRAVEQFEIEVGGLEDTPVQKVGAQLIAPLPYHRPKPVNARR